MKRCLFICSLFLLSLAASVWGQEGTGLKLMTFDVDATPQIGSELTYQTMINSGELSLRARGLVLLGAGQPIVLCSVDWIGIGNESQDAFKEALAEAAGTVPDRVEVHTVHQHDAPICDFTGEKILREHGLPAGSFDGTFARQVIRNIQDAIRRSISAAKPVTSVGFGKADVRKVASNRLVKMKDGTYQTRYSAEPSRPEIKNRPEGHVDREVSLVSFWNGEQPLAVLSFYATHPQSYYLTGVANPDFPGVARYLRQMEVPDALHIHFNGAGGNISAGKYNDGSHRNRLILGQRLAKGMGKAWKSTKKIQIGPEEVKWLTEPMELPFNDKVKGLEDSLCKMSRNTLSNSIGRIGWYRRRLEGRRINASCLALGDDVRILFMPGELYVEYQLAAKNMAPKKFVAMAAYGDYGPFYIPTRKAYDLGGYEVSSTPVTADVENYIMNMLQKLLESASL